MQIFDDFLPTPIYQNIKEQLENKETPWYYLTGATGAGEGEYAFSHNVWSDGNSHSPLFKDLQPLLWFIEDKSNLKIKELLRIRIGMNTRIANKNILNGIHSDYQTIHHTFLFYVNDSDGDTYFYKELAGESTKDRTLLARVNPKANRGVLFDGLRYHNSSHPVKNDRRIAVNINFKAE